VGALGAGLGLALGADAEDFEGVGDVAIAEVAGSALEFAGDAIIEDFDFATAPADDVVVVVGALVDFVAVGAVAEVASAQHADLLHGLEGPVDGDDIAAFALELMVELFRAERAVLAGENSEHGFAGLGDAHSVGAQLLQGARHGIFGRVLIATVRHCGEGSAKGAGCRTGDSGFQISDLRSQISDFRFRAVSLCIPDSSTCDLLMAQPR
jgi:hypothetical protein